MSKVIRITGSHQRFTVKGYKKKNHVCRIKGRIRAAGGKTESQKRR